jgi:hypothetical protein
VCFCTFRAWTESAGSSSAEAALGLSPMSVLTHDLGAASLLPAHASGKFIVTVFFLKVLVKQNIQNQRFFAPYFCHVNHLAQIQLTQIEIQTR